MIPTREQAFEILKQYNNEQSHIHHAHAVEAAMRHFAELYHEDPDLCGVVGILHDIDWEQTTSTPEKHCHLAPDMLKKAGVDDDIIRAVQSHGFGICTDIEPLSNLEKTLFTIDELTGLIITAGLVRPSKSLADLELKSVKKKWKDKAFARGVNREIIKQGAEKMNMPLDDVINETIIALRPVEKLIGM